jgi:hypothetical protein
MACLSSGQALKYGLRQADINRRSPVVLDLKPDAGVTQSQAYSFKGEERLSFRPKRTNAAYMTRSPWHVDGIWGNSALCKGGIVKFFFTESGPG